MDSHCTSHMANVLNFRESLHSTRVGNWVLTKTSSEAPGVESQSVIRLADSFREREKGK